MSRQILSKKIIRRIFIAQFALIIISAIVVIFLSLYTNQLGSFIFAFFFGCFGGSISLLRRMHEEPVNSLELIADSWISNLMPLMYGGLMASVTYMLFVSGLLTGVEGQGLFTSNLFPDFTNISQTTDEALNIRHILDIRPVAVKDAGKLMVWCFLAGYSEKFVTQMLSTLEGRVSGDKKE